MFGDNVINDVFFLCAPPSRIFSSIILEKLDFATLYGAVLLYTLWDFRTKVLQEGIHLDLLTFLDGLRKKKSLMNIKVAACCSTNMMRK